MKMLGIPKGKIYLSLSGGIDSMVLAHFLINGKKDFSVIHFNHGTQYGNKASLFVEEFCFNRDIPCRIYNYEGKNNSEYEWAEWRRRILTSSYLIGPSYPVLTAHHKDDSLESLLMRHHPISYLNKNIYRPLLAATKQEIRDYASNNGVEYMEDPTNSDPESGLRNKIRNELIPLMRECKINPYRFLENCPC